MPLCFYIVYTTGMRAKLQKWGNSLALRIPKAIAEELKTGQGSEVDIISKEGCLVVKPIMPEKSIEVLLEKITAENTHEPIDFGKLKGKEIW